MQTICHAGDRRRYGILPNGTLMRSPCGSFLWQRVALNPWQKSKHTVESLRRIGTGTKDVQASVRTMKERGVEFVDSSKLHPDDRGALTGNDMEGLAVELVHVSN